MLHIVRPVDYAIRAPRLVRGKVQEEIGRVFELSVFLADPSSFGLVGLHLERRRVGSLVSASVNSIS